MEKGKLLFVMLIFYAGVTAVQAQQQSFEIHLWKNGAPGFEKYKNEPEQAKDYWVKHIYNPSITVFLPDSSKATGTGVLVCPGGGHALLVYNAEGRDCAKFLNSIGVTAFVLKYRLFREEGSPFTINNTKQDAYRAMRLIRANASKWGIDPDRLGVMGFSAGGEVAAMIAYTDGNGDPSAPDPVDRLNGKPDFQILIYPGPLGIPDSLPKDAPPAFMVAAIGDPCCSAPIIQLIKEYHDEHLSAEAHIYAQGTHAFNMGQRSEYKTLKTWPDRLADWMLDAHLLQR